MSDIEPPEAPEPTHGPPAAAGETPPSDEAQLSEFFHTDELPARGEQVRSHRGTVDVTPYFARLLAPATAVIVVIVVIVLLIWINGSSSAPGHQAAVLRPSSAASGAAALSTPHSTAPSTPPSTPPSIPPSTPAASATHRSSHHGAGPATPPPTHIGKPPNHAKAATVAAMAPVTVLNNSRRTGLAHAAAGQIRAMGWKIGTVGNLQGLVPASTVYYAPGDAAAARHLAHDFGSIERIEPNHVGHMHGSALTLVVTANWRL